MGEFVYWLGPAIATAGLLAAWLLLRHRGWLDTAAPAASTPGRIYDWAREPAPCLDPACPICAVEEVSR